MGKLEGKIAVVTGGSRDIGRAISIRLARDGAKVCVNYFHSESEAQETIEEIRSLGYNAVAFKADVTNAEDIERCKGNIIKKFGKKIDILVNNAGGLFARKRIEEIDEQFYDRLMDVNFRSVFLVTKAFKPLMSKGSSIINLSSQAARDGGGPGASIYAASKGAVMAFTRSLAKEFGPEGIRVNSVCPGMIATRFHDEFTKNEVREKVASDTPLKREGDAFEVADLISYLASEKSSFITGNNIDINGGLAFS